MKINDDKYRNERKTHKKILTTEIEGDIEDSWKRCEDAKEDRMLLTIQDALAVGTFWRTLTHGPLPTSWGELINSFIKLFNI